MSSNISRCSSTLKFDKLLSQNKKEERPCCCHYCNGAMCLNHHTYSILKTVCNAIVRRECPAWFTKSRKKSRLEELRDEQEKLGRIAGGSSKNFKKSSNSNSSGTKKQRKKKSNQLKAS